MTWEYRVIRHLEPAPGGKMIEWLTIHRVYYNGERITSWEPEQSKIGGETLEELGDDIEIMRLALFRPVLKVEEMPK